MGIQLYAIMRDSFWITNISKRIISVGDLGILIYPQQSINLIDKKHSSLREEEIEKSISTGSLNRVRHQIIVRKSPPIETKNLKGANLQNQIEEIQSFPSTIRSIIEHKEFDYDELYITDDQYAEENADLADEDDIGKFRKG